MARSVLVLGWNSRGIACSAKRAGYKVYSVSHYDDLDLMECVEEGVRFEDHPGNVKPFLDKYKVDHVVLGSGFEGSDIDPSLVLGNDPRIARDVINKVWLAKRLNEMGIRHPRIFSRRNVEFPCIAKPIVGGGGHKNFVVKDESMLPGDEYFLQELIKGRPLSVSVLSDAKDAVPVSLNEILVGKKWLGQRLEFGYCGNVTPYKTKHHDEIYGIARKLIPALGLVGSNGIDFMVDENGPCVLEVNPRFQGSIDTVELATGENMFKAHVDALEGYIVRPKIRQYAIKGIVFATRKTLVTGSMLRPMIADVPKPGSVFGPDEAIVTITGNGATRSDASAMLKKNLSFVKKNLKALRK